MNTKLIEFENTQGQTLRWMVTLPQWQINRGVICVHWFERCTTTEKKFKTLADSLAQQMIATLRFDFSWCGLSDGDFRYTTIERQWKEFFNAIKTFQKEIWLQEVDVVAHSLWACVLANQLDDIKNQLGKVILIAPALNQKDLLRYRFVTSQMKKTNPAFEITWSNFKSYLNEQEFIKDCQRSDKMTKLNYINPPYFLFWKDLDFSDIFKNYISKVLHIHWDKDAAVPLESLNISFENQIIVTNGDHDLEKPNQIDKWLLESVKFLIKW